MKIYYVNLVLRSLIFRKIMILHRFICVGLLVVISLSGMSQDKNLFISPLKIPLLLSGNFGELRSDHFHSGIDIKTQGAIGREVVAPADGYVYRISVAPSGYGKALYIMHDNGYSTVYGHLDRFNDEIGKYVKERQYQQRNFTVNLYPQENELVYKQGDLIAYSGNSGSSGGPHLHYEIRKADTEEPVNPLLFSFNIRDNIAPILERLYIYPLSNSTSINGKNSTVQLDLAGGRGNYNIPAGSNITISGKAGFGIRSYDLLNDSQNKCAAYSIELIIDSTTIFKYMMSDFSFDETRYINSHIDYETYIRSRVHVQRTFILPNDRLRTYSNVINRGIFDFNDDKTHKVTLYVNDVYGNRSTLSFNVKSVAESNIAVAPKDDTNIIVMPYNRQNRFEAENVRVTIPNNALYDTLRFQYNRIQRTGNALSDVHQISSRIYPLHQACTISIKPDVIIKGKEQKMMIISVNGNSRSPLNSSVWEGEYLTATTTTFGNFSVGIDTIAPTITPLSFPAENNFTGRREMRIRIKDEFSGIKSYEPEIDGEWALFDYDQKNDVIVYQFDESKITKGTRHSLILKVSDRKDNVRTYITNFRW